MADKKPDHFEELKKRFAFISLLLIRSVMLGVNNFHFKLRLLMALLILVVVQSADNGFLRFAFGK